MRCFQVMCSRVVQFVEERSSVLFLSVHGVCYYVYANCSICVIFVFSAPSYLFSLSRPLSHMGSRMLIMVDSWESQGLAFWCRKLTVV